MTNPRREYLEAEYLRRLAASDMIYWRSHWNAMAGNDEGLVRSPMSYSVAARIGHKMRLRRLHGKMT